jgi:hypothetical protein
MEITPESYELPGSFYLGRGYDIETKKLQDDLILYDSKDLVTHGVVLGMTGSGKTGLCMALLEEAAMDGIPVIAIDPKGDIANFLLQFPNLSAEEFQPWVNEEDARKKGKSVEDFAAGQAAMWEKGLGEWGQSKERVRQLRERIDVNVFTPGSNAGIPVSIVASLDAPPEEVLEDAEIFNERVESCATSLLSLAGVSGDPMQSPEHILLANIFTACWRKGRGVTLESLVQMVQQPPFNKIGVVAVEEFLSEKKRIDLAMKLNNLIASPSFSSWLEGVPLDMQQMLYTPEGKPRVSIFSIAHLSDEQRMFFVTLLLNQTLSWMRSQTGTTSLRAVLYMDEIFGYLPPTANPPSKKPMMILLKQARAFGLGILLATQNPVDLDYKALSNIGTWWLGRLQTERDKMRVLDGLEGAASSQNVSFKRSDIEKLLANLGSRVFLMNNVHEDGPVVFSVRWIMTYLRGPLSRNQIKDLMDPKRAQFKIARSKASDGVAKVTRRKARTVEDAEEIDDEDAAFLPPGSRSSVGDDDEAASGGAAFRPKLPASAVEYFLPANSRRVNYRPALLRSATVLFIDEKKKINSKVNVTVANPIDTANAKIDWDSFVELERETDLAKLDKEPVDGASFATLPNALLKDQVYKAQSRPFVDWVFANYQAEVTYSPLLNAYSNFGEAANDFRIRVAQTARELRDQAVEELRTKMAKQVESLKAKYSRAMQKVETQKSQASSARWSTVMTVGASVLGTLFGRKSRGGLVTATTMNKVGSAWRESKDVENAEQEAAQLEEQIRALDKQFSEEKQKIIDTYDTNTLVLETARLVPMKKNITVNAVGILWVA